MPGRRGRGGGGGLVLRGDLRQVTNGSTASGHVTRILTSDWPQLRDQQEPGGGDQAAALPAPRQQALLELRHAGPRHPRTGGHCEDNDIMIVIMT